MVRRPTATLSARAEGLPYLAQAHYDNSVQCEAESVVVDGGAGGSGRKKAGGGGMMAANQIKKDLTAALGVLKHVSTDMKRHFESEEKLFRGELESRYVIILGQLLS